MADIQIPQIKSQALIGASLFLAGLWLAYQLGGDIVSGNLQSVALAGAAFVGGAGVLIILKNWRMGFYVFFFWLMFEDFLRKYMGNGLAFFFGKDILLACVYVAFYISVRQGREKTFRPPFLLFFSLFFWLAVLQLFNPYSPHILYGLLGLKVYFYYMPLLFVGYAMINSDEDLRKFLVVNAGVAGVIAAVGIAQAILGNSFLNPRTLAPELQELGDLTKVTPLTNQVFSLPASVFVSSSRFASYLSLSFVIVLGAAAYLLLYTQRSRRLIYLILGVIAVAVLMSGSRGTLLYVVADAVVISAALLWGKPATKHQSRQVSRTIRRSVVFAGVLLALLLLVFPKQAGSRIAFYSETLFPSSSAYQLSNRTLDYPLQNFLGSFQQGSWIAGHGIGTASLGRQYVAKFLNKPAPSIGVEEGYGIMILEMGVLAPVLWILWSAALLYYGWKTVRQLRGTRFFPLAFAFLWYAFVLLYPSTYASLNDYQNYISNAYLWLLMGILFRLPDILATSQLPAIIDPSDRESKASEFPPL